MKNNLQGDAQINTSVKEFGTGSIYFDGSDGLDDINTDTFNFATGQFTIEYLLE